MNWKGALCVFILLILLAEPAFSAVNQTFTSSSDGSTLSAVPPDVQTPQVTEHKASPADLAKLQSEEGVYTADASLNQTINGFSADAHPPTAQEWNAIAPNAYLVDSIVSPDGLPSSVDDSQTQWFPPIGVQNHGCNAFSVAYYTKTFQEAKEHGWNLNGAKWQGYSSSSYGYPTPSFQSEIMSPAFVYNLNDPSGSIESTISLVCNIGDCTWATMPYDGNSWTGWPSEAAWTEAAYYRGNSTTGYQYIDLTTDAGLNSLKSLLASQTLASIYINASALTPTNLTPQDFLTIDNYNAVTAAVTDHVNTIVGYDDSVAYTENGAIHYGAFKIANSWGAGVYHWQNTNSGFYWISYAAMEQRFKTCLFYNDLIGYQPTLMASFKIVDDKRSDCTITVGVGPVNSPIVTKDFSSFVSGYPYPYSQSDYLSFPDNNIVLDISEFENYLPSLSGQTFWLKVYDGGTVPGVITNFAVNSSSGYQVSSNVPCPLVNHDYAYVYVTFPAVTAFTVSPTIGPPGGAVTLQSTGLTVGSTASLAYLNPLTNQWVSIANNLAVSSQGTLTYSWSVPDLLQNNNAGDRSPLSNQIIFRVQDTGGLSYNTSVPYTEMGRALVRVGNAYASKVYGNNTDLTSVVSTKTGQSLSIAGCWFQPGAVTLLWDNTAVSSSTLAADEAGGFSTTFTVPSTSVGAHVITLQNGNTNFYVTLAVVPVVPLFTVANGVVYAYQGGTISAYQAASGTLTWSSTTNLGVTCMAADSNALYLGSAAGLSAMSVSTRSTLWSMSASYYQNAYALAVTTGAVYESTTAGYFMALDPNTGQTNGPDTGYYGSLPGGTTIYNGIIYLALQDGCLRAYTIPGTIYWRSDAYYGTNWASVAIDNGILFAGSANKVYAFNANNGNLVWSTPISGATGNASLAAADGQLYVGLGTKIYALNENNGAQLWSLDVGAAVSSLIASNSICVTSGAQIKHISQSGSVLWSYTTGGTVSSLAVAANLVIASSSDGNINTIDVASGQKVWDLYSYTPPTATPTPSTSSTAPPSSSSSSSTASPTPSKSTTTSSPSSSPSLPPTVVEFPSAIIAIVMLLIALIAIPIFTRKAKK